jgi:hypothetical protein
LDAGEIRRLREAVKAGATQRELRRRFRKGWGELQRYLEDGMDEEELGIGTVVKATDKAVLVDLGEIGEEKWIPRSVLGGEEDADEIDEGYVGDIVVQRWWAVKEQLV